MTKKARHPVKSATLHLQPAMARGGVGGDRDAGVIERLSSLPVNAESAGLGPMATAFTGFAAF